MTIDDIDLFLSRHTDIRDILIKVSSNFVITDFIITEPYILNCFNNKKRPYNLYSCLYENRSKWLRLREDEIEKRLSHEYASFLIELLTKNKELNIVLYIISYHYISLCKQLGYDLTVAKNALFPFCYDEISPLAMDNYTEYDKFRDSKFYGIVSNFNENDLKFYNECYNEYGNVHHWLKHFSLMYTLLGRIKVAGYYELLHEFITELNLFVFKYKVLYTIEQIHDYITKEKIQKIKINCGLLV